MNESEGKKPRRRHLIGKYFMDASETHLDVGRSASANCATCAFASSAIVVHSETRAAERKNAFAAGSAWASAGNVVRPLFLRTPPGIAANNATNIYTYLKIKFRAESEFICGRGTNGHCRPDSGAFPPLALANSELSNDIREI